MNKTHLTLNFISRNIDMDSIGFSTLIRSMINFVHLNVIPLMRKSLKSNDDAGKIEYYNDVTTQYLENKISITQLEESRVAAWREYDESQPNSDYKNALRVAICSLYDEKSSEFEIYGTETLIETFLSCLEDLRSNLPELFVSQLIEDF